MVFRPHPAFSDGLEKGPDDDRRYGSRQSREDVDVGKVRTLRHDLLAERFFAALDPAAFGWSFTANHAHMLPVGIEGFYRHFGPARMEEVRLADNRGGKEEHLCPGEGNVDFNAMFRLIEGDGYRGHYMLAFGNPEDMRAGRDKLVADWEAG